MNLTTRPYLLDLADKVLGLRNFQRDTVLPELNIVRNRILDDTAAVSAYSGLRLRVNTQSGDTFVYDPNSTETVDGSGVLDAIGKEGGRWVRDLTQNVGVNLGWFVKGDGQTDDTQNFRKAIAFAAARNAYLYDVGQPNYRITGNVNLKRGLSGIELNGLLWPEGSGYTVVTTDVTVRFKRFKLQIEGTGNTVNGLELSNPLICDFQTIRVHNLDGFGLKIRKCWDCNFFNVSIESCGNETNYAYSMLSDDDTSNMTNVYRLQVEKSHQLAMKVDPTCLNCFHYNIHSEQAHVSGTAKRTWDLGGNKGGYKGVRLHAQNGDGWNDTLAQVYLDLTYARMTEFSLESYSPVFAQSSSGGRCYIDNVILDTFSRTGGGSVYVNRGRITNLTGTTPGLHIFDVECTNVVVGFSANKSQALDFRGGSIGTLSRSDENSRIVCTGTDILGGDLVAENWLINCTYNLGTKTVGYVKAYLNNSVINGNLTTDNGHWEFINNSVVNGNLTCGVVLSMIFDSTSYVTGTVTGFGSPTSSELAGGHPVGRRTWNPKPTANGPEFWTCTVAGTNNLPGTWVPRSFASS